MKWPNRFKYLTYEELIGLSRTNGICSDAFITYCEMRRTFPDLDHATALYHTYRYSHSRGQLIGQPGLPVHESQLSFCPKNRL